MPQTTAAVSKELARQSADCSFILSHLVRQNGDRTDDDAKKILSLILNVEQSSAEPFLKSSSTGWYSSSPANIFNPTTRKFDGVRESAVVCFTESTLSGLKAHRDVFNAKYGLAFDREFVFSKGANPCLNIRESIFKQTFTCNEELYPRAVYNFIPSQLHAFVNIINESFDATHEREWRVPGDLKFAHDQVLFVFCPAADFGYFSQIQTLGRPVLFDLAWLDRV